jgi:CheY-like chemotaxis protein
MSNTHKILIVEDNDFVRMQLATFLKSDGYAVEETHDGKEGLSKIKEDIDLALVDVRMEPMGGFEFIRSLHSLNINVPIILVTGDKDPELLSDSSKLGVAAVLMKPVQKDRLMKTIQRTLERHEKQMGHT